MNQRSNYLENRKFSDKLLPVAMPIVKKSCPIYVASEFKDMKENTDLEIPNTSIAFRVRAWEKYPYKHEFKIRSKNDSGVPTELDKVVAGYGRYMLYATENETNDGFACYALIDLNVFRSEFHKKIIENNGDIPGVEFDNKDGTWGRSYLYADFPKSLVIDSQGLDDFDLFGTPLVDDLFNDGSQENQ